MITKEQITKIVDKKLKASDKFLVDVAVQPGNRILVFIDSDTSVSVDDCNELCRFIESQFDRDMEDFDLTVSSSGLDRPLKLLRQYKKNIGQELTVAPVTGEPLSGILVNVTESGIELEHPVKKPKKEIKKENSKLTFEEIKTAKIIIKFGK